MQLAISLTEFSYSFPKLEEGGGTQNQCGSTTPSLAFFAPCPRCGRLVEGRPWGGTTGSLTRHKCDRCGKDWVNTSEDVRQAKARIRAARLNGGAR